MFRNATLIAAALSTSVALPAFAGSPEPAVVEPTIIAAAPLAPVGPDWTGFYAGAQLGYANVDTNAAGVDGDDMIGGLTAGYDWDLGNYVVGVGTDYDFSDINLSPTNNLESIWRLKVRSGVKIGNGLLYISGGYAHVDVSGLGDEGGTFYGAGYEHMFTPNISLGGEVLYHEFDNVGSTTTDVDATTYQVRATYRF